MPAITRVGHHKGCIVGFDLAHAAGNIPLQLHDWDVDFAVWCSYKYLNGGPGCVGGCFVHERHARSPDLPRFAGWWGHEEEMRFQMGPEFQAMAGAEGWQLSNPPIFALAPLRASMEILPKPVSNGFALRAFLFTGYLDFLLRQLESPKFSIVTPREQPRKGAQISLRLHGRGRSVCDRLIADGVIGDWREPDTYRVAPIPLYNRYLDVYRFVQRFNPLLRQ